MKKCVPTQTIKCNKTTRGENARKLQLTVMNWRGGPTMGCISSRLAINPNRPPAPTGSTMKTQVAPDTGVYKEHVASFEHFGSSPCQLNHPDGCLPQFICKTSSVVQQYLSPISWVKYHPSCRCQSVQYFQLFLQNNWIWCATL